MSRWHLKSRYMFLNPFQIWAVVGFSFYLIINEWQGLLFSVGGINRDSKKIFPQRSYFELKTQQGSV